MRFEIFAEKRHFVEIAFERRASQTLQRGLGAQKTRGSGNCRIGAAERAENSAADRKREISASLIFNLIVIVPAVSGETFIATIATERDRYETACHGGDVISRNGGRIRERLVEMPGQFVQNFDGVWVNEFFVVVGVEKLG